MPQYVAKRFILEGRVQGVGCRAQVQEWVDMIGHISGFVRNLPNGSVEVCVKGPDWRLKDLEDSLRERMIPPVKIQNLRIEDLDLDKTPLNDGFRILRE
jgi:acylphosphatase